MTYRLTVQQRCVLADCVRSGLVGWLLTDPIAGQMARRWEHQSTTICGFSFSRFTNSAITHLTPAYHPSSPGSAAEFPLSISEAAALANNIELELSTDDQLYAAGLIACHSPYAQPEVCGRDWRTYTAMLKALGLSIDDDRPAWRQDVREALMLFRLAVAASAVPVPAAAE